MVQINFARREISCKVVYYGPGMSGKTTNLEKVYEMVPESAKGRFTSIATDGDRTLFFDLLPLDVGKIGSLDVKFQLYTVPGQVYYNATRKLVLRGADGIIFVADSSPDKMDENLQSMRNLKENLKTYGIDISDLPLVIQYNKRDLSETVPVEEMEATLNDLKSPSVEAVAIKGQGVLEALRECSELVLKAVSLRAKDAVGPEPKTTTIFQKGGVLVAAKGAPRPAPHPVASSPRKAASTPPPQAAPREFIPMEPTRKPRSWLAALIIALIVIAAAAAVFIRYFVK